MRIFDQSRKIKLLSTTQGGVDPSTYQKLLRNLNNELAIDKNKPGEVLLK
jgi:hypothetical protein